VSANFADLDAPPRRMPAPLARVLASLPAWPPTAALAAILSVAAARRLIDVQALAPLTAKCVELHVIDAGVRLRLQFTGRAFVPDCRSGSADVVIAASAQDFFFLAQRRVDPDSLFFRRRLIMEGDTELGLLVKNTLDAVDLTSVFPFFSKAKA